MRRRTLLRAGGAWAGGAWAGGAWAGGAWTGGGPVSIIVPAFPDAPAGLAARLLQPSLERELDRPVIADFRPGAGGITGLGDGARAPADGATLTLLTPAIVAAPWLSQRMDWTPRDFAPIGRISFTPEVLVVAAGSPWRTLAGLMAALRAHPGTLPAPFDGAWSSAEIAEVMFLDRAGLAARPVAGSHIAAGLADGTLAFAVSPMPWALAGIAAGRLRALAVSAPADGDTPRDAPPLPGVQRFRDLGLEVTIGSWLVLAAPAGTPASVLAPLRAALREAMAAEGLRARLAAAGIAPAWLDGPAAEAAMAAEYRALGRLFTAIGANWRAPSVASR
jgi:tripartite-type tricarboxylate transporter receptor subunit TctC